MLPLLLKFCFILMYVLVTYMFHYGIAFIFNCYLLTPFVYWIDRKYHKRKFYQSVFCLFTHFGMIEIIFVLMFLSMHVVNFMFWVYMLWNWNSHMARNYHFTISLKKGLVKILTRFSISPVFQTKVNFKVIAFW